MLNATLYSQDFWLWLFSAMFLILVLFFALKLVSRTAVKTEPPVITNRIITINGKKYQLKPIEEDDKNVTSGL